MLNVKKVHNESNLKYICSDCIIGRKLTYKPKVFGYIFNKKTIVQ